MSRANDFSNDETRWQAVLKRDKAADNRFFYAVKTTAIYCIASCPARKPKREHVSFYSKSEAAEAAGFRPCKRCRPHQVNPQSQRIAHIQHLLETREPAPSLKELAKEVQLSPFYLQRIFKQATGLSPKQYSKALKATRLEKQLKQGDPVSKAMYTAGYASSRELYEQVGKELGMTPTSFKQGGKGIDMMYASFDSPLGPIFIAATNRGISALHFGRDMLPSLKQDFPHANFVHAPDKLASYAKAIKTYLSQRGSVLELPLDVKASDFQRRVWQALKRIPLGETRSYKDIAEMIQQPTAARAVARACATNPVALVIPCHRVVRSGGALSGYRWGVGIKRELLEHEAKAPTS